jgi:hypothetical protein
MIGENGPVTIERMSIARGRRDRTAGPGKPVLDWHLFCQPARPARSGHETFVSWRPERGKDSSRGIGNR